MTHGWLNAKQASPKRGPGPGPAIWPSKKESIVLALDTTRPVLALWLASGRAGEGTGIDCMVDLVLARLKSIEYNSQKPQDDLLIINGLRGQYPITHYQECTDPS